MAMYAVALGQLMAAGRAEALPVESAIGGGSGFVLAQPRTGPDPCEQAEIVAAPTRPNWDAGAATIPCGMVQTDYGWQSGPMGGGVRQWMLVSSATYGLTPKLDLRWGLTNHMVQSGGGLARTEGVGDQTVTATYNLRTQGRWLPAMAASYGIKIPMANPAKGFGTGFVDHQFAWIASRDVGRNHFDFNAVGVVTGGAAGHDGASQFGLALTRPVTARLSWILESYGGPLPGTADRYGAGLTGISYSPRPRVALDAAIVKTYTAGTPRSMVLVGVTIASRAWFKPLPRGSRIARLLGR